MIVCKPSCKSKTFLKENIVFFNSVREAIALEFRPCKRYRPDLVDYEPNAVIVNDLEKYMTSNYMFEGHGLHVSDSHLKRLFKLYKNITVNEF